MTKSGIFCLYGIGCVATTALCGFRSVSQAGCVVIIYVIRKIMSECRRFFLLYKHFAATAAMLAFGQTRCRASCFYCFIGYLNVTERIGFLDFRVSARSTTPG